MMGYGPEDKNAVLELTYNYGITEYDKGNAYAQVLAVTPLLSVVNLLLLFIFLRQNAMFQYPDLLCLADSDRDR